MPEQLYSPILCDKSLRVSGQATSPSIFLLGSDILAGRDADSFLHLKVQSFSRQIATNTFEKNSKRMVALQQFVIEILIN
jgi:hypothetical protein